MLTKLVVRNFKKLSDVTIDLGKSVVFIGPNNSGKTTALQALALWDIGLRSWLTERGGKALPEKRPGVTINRKDLIAIPVPSADLLWYQLHLRNSIDRKTKNVRIDVVVDGITNGTSWHCGFEFDYSNPESFVCRPVRESGFDITAVKDSKFTAVPEHAGKTKIAYLPPMSGLATVEPKWEPGRINVLIGEGQTAQVLRNLCWQIYNQVDHSDWNDLCATIKDLFLVDIQPPEFIPGRGEIIMAYTEPSGTRLDLSCAGRGLQQTLLLLSYLYANPNTVLLLDEPDAHLEILRQRQTYNLICDLADKQGSQIIAASHSEVVLNEAAGKATVVAFVGRPHTLNDRPSQVLKALKDIGFDQYYQAEQAGWVLYLEDSTDLAVLRVFADKLQHPAGLALKQPFVHYVATNLPQKARDHFGGLCEGKPDLLSIMIFDRLDKILQPTTTCIETMWRRREIENYFCTEDVLLRYAAANQPDDLFGTSEKERRIEAMRESIKDVTHALTTLGKPEPWSPDIKATDDFLEPLFKEFSAKLGLPLLLRKNEYFKLALLAPAQDLDPEIAEKLDCIADVAKRARPRED
jgi:ABC-type uncharacterized transport system YnjBCD ATPase subunit